jgi:hypothetical protein
VPLRFICVAPALAALAPWSVAVGPPPVKPRPFRVVTRHLTLTDAVARKLGRHAKCGLLKDHKVLDAGGLRNLLEGVQDDLDTNVVQLPVMDPEDGRERRVSVSEDEGDGVEAAVTLRHRPDRRASVVYRFAFTDRHEGGRPRSHEYRGETALARGETQVMLGPSVINAKGEVFHRVLCLSVE